MDDNTGGIQGLESDDLPEKKESGQKVWFFSLFGAGLLYCLTYAVISSWIAFVEPAVRDRSSSIEIILLFPFGNEAYFLSQLFGGFLLATSNNVLIANLGASVPLFVTGFLVATAHLALISIAVFIVRRFIRLGNSLMRRQK